MEKVKAETDRTVWIIRHGNRIDFVDPTWHERIGGDPHLSEDGVVQARETGSRLVGEGIRRIFASPFLRTAETAHYVAEALDLPIFLEQGACEWLLEEWFPRGPEFVSSQEMAERFGRIDPAYQSIMTPSYPETEAQVLERAGTTMRRLAEKYQEPFLVIGHGASVHGMTKGLVKDCQGLSAGLCALIKIVRSGGAWALELRGDTSHLSGGAKHALRLS